MGLTILGGGEPRPRTRDFRYTDSERRVLARCLEIAAAMLDALDESEQRIAELTELRDDLMLGLDTEQAA
jgi:hypothetical protein